MKKICCGIAIFGLCAMIVFIGLKSVYLVGYQDSNIDFKTEKLFQWFDMEQPTVLGGDLFTYFSTDPLTTFSFPTGLKWLNIFIVPIQALLRFCNLILRVLYFVGKFLIDFPSVFLT